MITTMTPPMTFGVAAPDEPAYDGGGNGGYMQYFGEDGEYRLRFLDNWTSWTSYWEHFSATKRASYPCTAQKKEDKENCPGCTCGDEKEARASKKYLTNAVLVSTTGKKAAAAVGTVHLWKIPGGLREKIMRAYEKSSVDPEDRNITDRDFEVYRSTGARTEYDIERQAREPFDASDLPLQDHQEALRESWLDAWDDERLAARAKRDADRKAEKAGTKTVADSDQAEVPDALKTKTERGLSMVKDEPEPAPAEEQLELTTSGIRKMSRDDLLKVYKLGGFEVPEGLEDKDLAEDLIQKLS